MCQARSGNTCICDTKIFEREREGSGGKKNYVQIGIYKCYHRSRKCVLLVSCTYARPSECVRGVKLNEVCKRHVER